MSLLDRLQDWLLRVDMAVWRFFTRLKCDEAGHPITYTGSGGRSGCACGKVSR